MYDEDNASKEELIELRNSLKLNIVFIPRINANNFCKAYSIKTREEISKTDKNANMIRKIKTKEFQLLLKKTETSSLSLLSPLHPGMITGFKYLGYDGVMHQEVFI